MSNKELLVGIILDKYKLPHFYKLLKEANIKVNTTKESAPDLMSITCYTDKPEKIAKILQLVMLYYKQGN